MADGQEEDFSQLPVTEQFVHKNWKARKGGYEAAAKEFECTPDESDPAFGPFLGDPSLWKGAAGDSNVAAQQEGLAALCAFLKYGGQQAATKSRNFAIQPIYEKGLSSARPAAKANSLEALLLYVELDKPDLVVEELVPALSHKQPKIIAATLAAIASIVHNFGIKIVDPKPIVKVLPKAFGHADKNVRAEAQNLSVELYRWLKEAMKPLFWDELKPVQQQDLEKLFEKVKEAPPPKQERLTRVQQAARAAATAAPAADEPGIDQGGANDEEPVEVDVFDLAEPVDVYAKIPSDFDQMVSSTKWKERKDALDALFAIVNTPRIKDGSYDDLVRAFAKCMKDANIAVVTVAANCVEKLAQGLRRGFAKYRSTILVPMLERLKEKKQSVADAIGAALDAVFASSSLGENLEEIITFLQNKNPNVKIETTRFLIRCLRNTRDVPSKDEQKRIADAGTKLLTESTEDMRSGGAEILGTLMKIIGERAMGPYLEGLDDIRKTKIKGYFDTAEVKAKEKPKPVAAPPKAATGVSAAGKKVVAAGGKKPIAKKPITAPPPSEDSAPLQPKPTAKSLPKPGGVARPLSGSSQPAGLKLGGLKKPTASAISSPRRVISPPVSVGDEEDAGIMSPSKLGMNRGLAGRSLARPLTAPLSPPPSQPVPAGLSAIERAELEELRAEKDRLSSLCDSLRAGNAKLTAEISELQNQNAQLIEDHTRDVLQIKAKETQLVRARGECDVLRGEAEGARKENERYKREVSRLGRESIGREREDMSRGRQADGMENGIYEDNVRANGTSRPQSGAGSAAASRAASARPQPAYSEFRSPSEEKENTQDPFTSAASRKISPPVQEQYGGSRRMSPQRPAMAGREISAASTDGGGPRDAAPAENWKRAAEVTSQLKARIEAMKARQALTRGH